MIIKSTIPLLFLIMIKGSRVLGFLGLIIWGTSVVSVHPYQSLGWACLEYVYWLVTDWYLGKSVYEISLNTDEVSICYGNRNVDISLAQLKFVKCNSKRLILVSRKAKIINLFATNLSFENRKAIQEFSIAHQLDDRFSEIDEKFFNYQIKSYYQLRNYLGYFSLIVLATVFFAWDSVTSFYYSNFVPLFGLAGLFSNLYLKWMNQNYTLEFSKDGVTYKDIYNKTISFESKDIKTIQFGLEQVKIKLKHKREPFILRFDQLTRQQELAVKNRLFMLNKMNKGE